MHEGRISHSTILTVPEKAKEPELEFVYEKYIRFKSGETLSDTEREEVKSIINGKFEVKNVYDLLKRNIFRMIDNSFNCFYYNYDEPSFNLLYTEEEAVPPDVCINMADDLFRMALMQKPFFFSVNCEGNGSRTEYTIMPIR